MRGAIQLCPICGNYNKLDIHHKDGNHKNNEEDNLISICRLCHMSIHKNLNGKPMGVMDGKRKEALLFNTNRLNQKIIDLRRYLLENKYSIKIKRKEYLWL